MNADVDYVLRVRLRGFEFKPVRYGQLITSPTHFYLTLSTMYNLSSLVSLVLVAVIVQ